MARVRCPFADWPTRINATLHGRSVYRPVDVPGHNVFKGYSTWETNGHDGVGDAVDLFAPGRTAVLAMHDGAITEWRNDASRLEVVYLEGGGLITVYAHVNFNEAYRVGAKLSAGDPIARVRGDLTDPHLHLEVWADGKAISGRTPAALLDALKSMSSGAAGNDLADEWARPAQEWVKAHGISDGTRPRDPVTRQECWQMIMEACAEITKR